MSTHGRATTAAPLAVSMLLAGVVSLNSALVASQQPGEVAPATLRLEVVATDTHGRPVGGLTAENFEVRLDGEPTRIESVAQAKDDPLRLLLLFDQTDTTGKEQTRIAQGLAGRFREAMPPGVEVAVGVYDGQIRVVQPFTTGGGIVAEVIENLPDPGVRGEAERFGRGQLIRDMTRIQTCDPIEEVTSCTPEIQRQIKLRARDVLNQVEQYIHAWNGNLEEQLEALTQGVRSVAGLPGRKALLYIGSGLDLQPGQELLRLWDEKFGPIAPGEAHGVRQATLTGDVEAPMRRVSEVANAARVTLYSVATVGDLDQRAVSGRERRLNLRPSGSPAARADRTWDTSDDAAFRMHQGVGINRLSRATGGASVFGANELGSIVDRIAQDATSAYTVILRAGEASGANHEIRVRLTDREGRVRHRRALPIREPREEAIDRTQAALTWDVADNPLAVEAVFEPTQSPPEGEGVVQPIQVKVPMAKIAWDETRGSYRGRLSLFAATQDATGAVSPMETIDVPIEVPREAMAEAKDGYGGYRFGLLLRPGRYRFAVGVLDEIGGAISVVVSEREVLPSP